MLNKSFFVLRLGIFVFGQTLQLGNLQDPEYDYNKSSFKILAQNNPNKAFLFPVLVIYIFPRTFGI